VANYLAFLAVPLVLSSCDSTHPMSRGQISSRAALLNPSHKYWQQTAPAIFRVRFETSKGDFALEARRDLAPRGVDRCYNLVRAGFFDDSRFFRVRTNYIAQFGIPGTRQLPASGRIKPSPMIPSARTICAVPSLMP
jgi:hypothetical protein